MIPNTSVPRALKRLCAKHRASAKAEVRGNAKCKCRSPKENGVGFAECWGCGGKYSANPPLLSFLDFKILAGLKRLKKLSKNANLESVAFGQVAKW